MTKSASVFNVTAFLFCLAIGNAVAEDKIETQQAKPEVTNNQQEEQSKPNPKPEEDVTTKNSSQGSAAKEEPECN